MKLGVFVLTLISVLAVRAQNLPLDRDRNLELDIKAILENSVLLFKYEINQKSQLILQDQMSMSRDEFGMVYGSAEELFPQVAQILPVPDSKQKGLFLYFNQDLMDPQGYEIITQKGEVIFDDKLNRSETDGWIEKLKKNDSASGPTSRGVRPESKAQLLRFFHKKLIQKIEDNNKNHEPFRLCLFSKSEDWYTRMCSQFYSLSSANGVYQLNELKNPMEVRVFVNNEKVADKQELKVSPLQSFHFFAELATGQSYEINTMPPDIHILKIKRRDKKNFYLQGQASEPRVKAQGFYEAQKPIPFFRKLFLNSVKKWNLEVESSRPKLFFDGEPYGTFAYQLALDSIQEPEILPQFVEDPPLGTYGSEYTALLEIPEGSEFKRNRSLNSIRSKKNMYEWNLQAPFAYEENENNLVYKYKDKQVSLSYPLYREFGNHLTFRFAATTAPMNKISYLSGLELASWYDHFLWMKRPWATLRWGTSLNYFTSLNGLGLSSATSQSNLAVTSFELKYRLFSGLDYRDSGFGFQLPLMNVSYVGLSGNVLGVGCFFRQDFPLWLGGTFEKLHSFFYGHKTLDAKLNIYTTSLTKDLQLGKNYELEVDLRMKKGRWNLAGGFSKRGFGLTTVNQGLNLDSFFLNLGVGVFF